MSFALILSTRAIGETILRIVIPSEAQLGDCNNSSRLPFTFAFLRYQQVYAASEFSTLTNYGGGWLASSGVVLSGIWFRDDVKDGFAFGATIRSLRLSLSTTLRAPDNLSPVFAEN